MFYKVVFTLTQIENKLSLENSKVTSGWPFKT